MYLSYWEIHLISLCSQSSSNYSPSSSLFVFSELNITFPKIVSTFWPYPYQSLCKTSPWFTVLVKSQPFFQRMSCVLSLHSLVTYLTMQYKLHFTTFHGIHSEHYIFFGGISSILKLGFSMKLSLYTELIFLWPSQCLVHSWEWCYIQYMFADNHINKMRTVCFPVHPPLYWKHRLKQMSKCILLWFLKLAPIKYY